MGDERAKVKSTTTEAAATGWESVMALILLSPERRGFAGERSRRSRGRGTRWGTLQRKQTPPPLPAPLKRREG